MSEEAMSVKYLEYNVLPPSIGATIKYGIFGGNKKKWAQLISEGKVEYVKVKVTDYSLEAFKISPDSATYSDYVFCNVASEDGVPCNEKVYTTNASSFARYVAWDDEDDSWLVEEEEDGEYIAPGVAPTEVIVYDGYILRFSMNKNEHYVLMDEDVFNNINKNSEEIIKELPIYIK